MPDNNTKTKTMLVKSTYRFAKISAFKAREVTRAIQGLPASDALDLLRFTPKKAAVLILKTLKSAIANAENNNSLNAADLVVKEAVVGEGPTLKRFQPKARGSAGPIRKRTSHIKVVLTDEIEIVRRADKPKKKKKTSAKKPAKAKAPAETAEQPAAVAATPAPAAENKETKE
jgi:large subunit ribosomal protein L22